MNRRSPWISAREIASIRHLQLQRAISDASRARAALDEQRNLHRQAEAEYDAHLQAWRAAAMHDTLSPALLAHCGAALAPILAERDAASRRVDTRTATWDAARQALQQRERLAESADEHADREEKRYRQALDERLMTELEIRVALHGGVL